MAREKPQPVGYAAFVPPVAALDSQNVRMHLDAAQVLAENGDLREATRWLRRAAAAAEEDGNHPRAVVIARAAADLASRTRVTTVPPSGGTPSANAISVALVSMVRELRGLPDMAIPSSRDRAKMRN